MRSRMLLALLCCVCEAAFCVGVSRRFGRRVALYTLLGLLASAGMLGAAPAFLPSSFTMYGLMLCWGLWLHGGHPAAMAAAGAVGLLFGWPFALLALAPMAAHVALLETASLPRVLLAGGATAALSLGAQAWVDHALYGRWLLAQWNLFRYNALGVGGGGKGSDLYGVEPASFFFVNLTLNFNVIWLLAAASPLAVAALAWSSERARATKAIAGGSGAATTTAAAAAADSPQPGASSSGSKVKSRKSKAGSSSSPASAAAEEELSAEPEQEPESAVAAAAQTGAEADVDLSRADARTLGFLVAVLSQLWFWFAVMSSRPHKEERFMFPVFPLIPLAAAVVLVAAESLLLAPLFALGAGGGGGGAGAAEQKQSRQRLSLARAVVAGAVFLVAGAVSLSRVAALVYGFRAPVHVWEVLGRAVQAHRPEVENRDNLDGPAAPLVATTRPWLGLDIVFADSGNGTVLRGGQNYTPSVPPGVEALPPYSYPGVTVCVGKEWYRFPSHFFLPESTRVNAAKFPNRDLRDHRPGGPARLHFLRSNFSGQLPLPFLMRAGGSADANRSGFNDANEAWERYPFKSPDVCDFIVDLQLPRGRTAQPALEPWMAELKPIEPGSSFETVEAACSHQQQDEAEREAPPCICEAKPKSSMRFESVFCEPFLDRETSPLLARAFWVPGYSGPRASFGAYHILQRVGESLP